MERIPGENDRDASIEKTPKGIEIPKEVDSFECLKSHTQGPIPNTISFSDADSNLKLAQSSSNFISGSNFEEESFEKPCSFCFDGAYTPFQLNSKKFRDIFCDEFLEANTFDSVKNLADHLAKEFITDQVNKSSRCLNQLGQIRRDKIIERIYTLKHFLSDTKNFLLEIHTDALMALDTIFALARERAFAICKLFEKCQGGLQTSAICDYKNLIYTFENDQDIYIEKITSQYRHASSEVARWHQTNLLPFVEGSPNIENKLSALERGSLK